MEYWIIPCPIREAANETLSQATAGKFGVYRLGFTLHKCPKVTKQSCCVPHQIIICIVNELSFNS